MSNNHKQYHELRELVLRSLDDTITKDEVERLQAIIKRDSKARLYYRSFLAMYSDLTVLIGSKQDQKQSNDLYASLFELAEQESLAPELVIEKPRQNDMTYDPASDVKAVKFSKFYNIYNVIVSTAAVLMVLFIAYTNIFPAKPSVPTVTVINLSNAQWAQGSATFENGDRINTYSETFSLEKGVVELLYDYGASVIIEAPASFQVDSDRILHLEKGRSYTCVNTNCTGFTIETPCSTFVDIGTEFGVDVNSIGDSQLHVFKGEVILNTNTRSKSDFLTKRFYAGQAAEVENNSFAVRSIPISHNFVDSIKDPIFLEDFEDMPTGPLLDQPGWKTNSVYEASPIVVNNGLVGNRAICGVKMNNGVGGADYPLPEVIDLTEIKKPLYAGFIFEYDGNETVVNSKEVVLTLSEKQISTESSGVIEGLVNLEKGSRIMYSSGDQFVFEPGKIINNSKEKIEIGEKYLFVIKFDPQVSNDCIISLGYSNISEGVPDESKMQYSCSARVDPKRLMSKDFSDRYKISHIAISIRSESIIADNLILTDMWGHIRLLSGN